MLRRMREFVAEQYISGSDADGAQRGADAARLPPSNTRARARRFNSCARSSSFGTRPASKAVGRAVSGQTGQAAEMLSAPSVTIERVGPAALSAEIGAIVPVTRALLRPELLAAVVRDEGSGCQAAGHFAWAPAGSHLEDKPPSDRVALDDRHFKYRASVKAPAVDESREILRGVISGALAAAALVPTLRFAVGTDRD
jgi:hypothetical protein